jgi:hypothetical protein
MRSVWGWRMDWRFIITMSCWRVRSETMNGGRLPGSIATTSGGQVSTGATALPRGWWRDFDPLICCLVGFEPFFRHKSCRGRCVVFPIVTPFGQERPSLSLLAGPRRGVIGLNPKDLTDLTIAEKHTPTSVRPLRTTAVRDDEQAHGMVLPSART